ncbi:MAG: amidohydrolase family protein [Oscillospiraceae bacterium]|nr:amidohydrolase family protein [Oscillospiraceae bacterium]
MFDIVIAGGIIVSSHNAYKAFRGSVGISGDRIALVTQRELTPTDAAEFVDATGRIVMPGLINGHCHGDMAAAKGLGDGMTLLEQMTEFGKCGWFLPYLSDDERFYARQHTYCEALLSGTTTLIENMFWSLGKRSQQAFREVGLRGAEAEDIRYDFMESDAFLTDKMVKAFSAECEKNSCIPLLGTLPEEEFTEDRLKKTAGIVNASGCRFTSHLSETKWRYDAAIDKFGISPVKVLDSFGLLNERYIGSHGVWLDEDDVRIMAERGAKLISTPICELKIADGLSPIRKLLDSGVRVGLGTDGAMWNNSNDLFREMKCMALAHNLNYGANAITPKEILDMATVNGAAALGFESELGTIEEGKLADIILVNCTAPHMTPLHYGLYDNVSSALVFCATGADVTDVLVSGRFAVRDKKLTKCDLGRIQREVQCSSSELIKKHFRRGTS